MSYRFYFLFTTFLTLPFALRKVFWHQQGPYFSEYSDVSLYCFEVFLIGYIIFYILEHKNIIKSIIQKVFHVEHVLIFLLLILSTLISVFYTTNYFEIILVSKWLIYILFGALFYLDLAQIVPRGTYGTSQNTPNCSTWNSLKIVLIFSLTVQGIIIIFQFFLQKSLNLYWLGEGILSPSIAGVATIIFNSEELLRGYGTFLHPNVSAFFFFSYFLMLYLLTIVPRGTYGTSQNTPNCSTWNIWNFSKYPKLFHVEHITS